MKKFEVTFQIKVICNEEGFRKVKDLTSSPIDKKDVFEKFVNSVMEYENWNSIESEISGNRIYED